MKNMRSIFTDEQLEMLNRINVNLSDDYDYNDDELDAIYDKITDYYQVAAFDKNSEPLPIAYEWEKIIDTFYDEANL